MWIRKIGVLGALALSGFSSAAIVDLTVDVSNSASNDVLGAGSNIKKIVDVQAALPGYGTYRLVGIGWSLNMTAFTPSWLSDMYISIARTDQTDSVELRAAAFDDTPGSGNYQSAVQDLIGLGLDYELGVDNKMRFEYYEIINDLAGADGEYGAESSITLRFDAKPVPEPAPLAALALGALVVSRRRR